MNLFKKFFLGLRIVPKSTTTADEKGELEVDSVTGRLKFHDGTNLEKVVTDASVDSLINKTIDADGTGNVISNIDNGNIKSGANIAVDKLAVLTASRALETNPSGVVAPSSVTSTELGYLAGTTSGLQTQLTGKVSKSGDTMSGVLDMGVNAVRSSFTPVSANDLVNKAYADSIPSGSGGGARTLVRAYHTGWGPVFESDFQNGSIVDDVTLVTGDRILISDLGASIEEQALTGIYVVQATGAPIRATDANTWDKLVSAIFFVQEGTVRADTGWRAYNNLGGTLGVDVAYFEQITGNGVLGAGSSAISTNFNVIDIVLDGVTMVKEPSGLKVNLPLERLHTLANNNTGTDSASTGTAVTIPYINTIPLRLTNAGLVSIAGITVYTDINAPLGLPSYLILSNITGNDITILNDAGVTVEQGIITGTGSDLVLADNTTIYLYYDNYTERYRIVGATGSGGSGGPSRITTGTFAAPIIVADDGSVVATGGTDEDIYIRSQSGEGNLEVDPQVDAGTLEGQTLRLIGTSDINYVLLQNGDGLRINGDWYSYEGSVLTLRWDNGSSLWREVSRC